MKENNNYGSIIIEESIEQKLETWENVNPVDYFIHIEHPEFTSLCPRSGYPDFGTIVIDYIPQDKIVELKAIKMYVNSFRDRKISHEAVTNEIADKFYSDVCPKSLQIIGDFTRRGGIKTIITVFRGSKFDPPIAYDCKQL